jgi:diguanylate cyclase (GGDEF)-like protein/PAS domain S-box-containing protein
MLTNIVNRMPGLLAYVDADLRYRYANETYRSWRGLDPCEIIGRSFREIVGEANYPYLIEKANTALSGDAITYEHALFDGEMRRYVHGSYTPDRRSDGSVAGFIILVSDISDRHVLEEKLHRSERQFHNAFHSSAIGMAIVRPDGTWLDVNVALTDMLGYSSDELRALTFQDITHTEDMAIGLNMRNALIAGQQSSYQIEKRYIGKAGNIIHAIVSVCTVTNAQGALLHFVSQIQDITARRLAEDQLYEEHERSEVTLRSIGDGVITSDVHACVTWMNPLAEQLTGWSTADASGLPLEEVFRIVQENDTPLSDPLTRAIAVGQVVALEKDAILISRTGVRVPVADSAAPIRNRKGTIIGGVLVFQDVSEDRRFQKDLRHRVETDFLTGLPNRISFDAAFERALSRVRTGEGQVTLVFGDLDGFKPINDMFGHACGDLVLQEVARRLEKATRAGDLVSRWAGDEFGILLLEASLEDVRRVTERLTSEISLPINLGAYSPNPINISISLGVAFAPADGTDQTALLRHADAALYVAKKQRPRAKKRAATLRE